MLYRTKVGRIIDDLELNQLTAQDVEELGIHAIDPRGVWFEEA